MNISLLSGLADTIRMHSRSISWRAPSHALHRQEIDLTLLTTSSSYEYTPVSLSLQIGMSIRFMLSTSRKTVRPLTWPPRRFHLDLSILKKVSCNPLKPLQSGVYNRVVQGCGPHIHSAHDRASRCRVRGRLPHRENGAEAHDNC